MGVDVATSDDNEASDINNNKLPSSSALQLESSDDSNVSSLLKMLPIKDWQKIEMKDSNPKSVAKPLIWVYS